MEMLRDLAAGEGISPMAFSLSVHNAAAAIYSIVQGLRSPISAMAAGEESFGWGLIEAYSAWKTTQDSPVLYLYGDDCLPDELASFRDSGERLHAIGLSIGTPATHTVCVEWRETETPVVPPQPQSFHFLERLLSSTTPQEWMGRRLAWSWNVTEEKH